MHTGKGNGKEKVGIPKGNHVFLDVKMNDFEPGEEGEFSDPGWRNECYLTKSKGENGFPTLDYRMESILIHKRMYT